MIQPKTPTAETQSNKLFSLCDNCGRQTYTLMKFNRVVGVRPCIVTEIGGKTRESLKPVIIDRKELCYACYVQTVNKYLKEKRNET